MLRKLFTAAALTVALSTQVSAESSVWKIEKNGETAYLGGTIHLLRPTDEIPSEYTKALDLAEKVYVETDPAQLETPEMQQKMMALVSYPAGETLQSNLSPAVYAELDTFLAGYGIPIANLNQFKPSMISLTLLAITIQKNGYSMEGIDAKMQAKAMAANKAIGQLETVEQQLTMLSKMGEGEEDVFMQKTMKDMAEATTQFNQMIDLVKKGDMDTLEKEFLAPFASMPIMYKVLLKDRNDNWVKQIDGMMKTKEDELVLVGALHLVGKDGLLQQLKQKGYQISRL